MNAAGTASRRPLAMVGSAAGNSTRQNRAARPPPSTVTRSFNAAGAAPRPVGVESRPNVRMNDGASAMEGMACTTALVRSSPGFSGGSRCAPAAASTLAATPSE